MRAKPGTVLRKKPHHRYTYHVRSRALVATAYANPDTRCWRCGRTLVEHPPTRTGNPPRWSAGHTTDGQVNGPLAPEVLSCNSRAGALTQQKMGRPSTTTPPPPAPRSHPW